MTARRYLQQKGAELAEVFGPRLRRFDAWLIFAVAFVLLLPWRRNVELLGDEGVLLLGAQRLLAGERLYADFFEILPPGGFWLVAACLALTGGSFLATRLLAILIVCGTCAVLYKITHFAAGSRRFAVVVSLGFVVSTQGAWTAINHHWNTSFLLLSALWFLVRPMSAGRAAAAGGLMGLAVLSTHTQAAMLFLAGALRFLPRADRRALAAYVASCLAVGCAALGLLAATHSLEGAWQDVVIHPLRQYSGIQPLPFGANAALREWPVVLLFPICLGAAIVAALRSPRLRADPGAWTATAFAVAALGTAYPRPDATHLGFNLPLALPVLAFAWTELRSPARLGWGLAIAWWSVAWPGYVKQSFRATQRVAVTVERGAVVPGPATQPEDLVALLAHLRQLPREARLFAYPYLPMVLFLDGRTQSTELDVFIPGYTTPAQWARAKEDALSRTDWLVVDCLWADPAFLRVVYPSIPPRALDETKANEAAIEVGFVLHATFGARYKLMRRSPASDPAAR